MSSDKVAASVGALAVAVCAVGWYCLPMLQDAQDQVESRAAVQIERARRLLHQFDPDLAYRSILAAQLRERELQIDQERIDELADEYQVLHAALWEAYQPVDRRGDSVTGAKANYSNIAGQVRDGVKYEGQLAAQNDELLDEAISAVDEALNLSVGEASGKTNAEGNRLKATALYYQGLNVWSRARLKSLEADHLRRALRQEAAAATEAAATAHLVAGSRIDEQMARLQQEAADHERIRKEEQGKLASLDQTIRELQARIAAAEVRRQNAEEGIRRLKEAGVDFADPHGAERFGIHLKALNQAFREADRQIHELTYGDYSDATIDYSGDYLSGKYEGPGGAAPRLENGLSHFLDERGILAPKVARLDAEADAIRADIDRLTRMKDAFSAREADAASRLKQAATQAEETYTELNRIEAEAYTLEEAALKLLDQAATLAKLASGQADAWVNQAREIARDMSPETIERSAFGKRQRDGWMGGFIGAQEADARIARAWLFYDRFRSTSQTAEVLASLPPEVALPEADPEAERQKAVDTQQAGVNEIKLAMSALQQAHGKADRSWTLTAQAAGATYLLALFGFDEYRGEALEAYRTAVKGREDQPGSEPFMSRISQLEKRK